MNSHAMRTGVVLTVTTFVLLSVVVVGVAMFVLPAYLEMYAGAAWQLPWPTRAAFALGHPGILIAALVLGGAFLLFRLRGPDAAVARLAVGSGANLVLTLLFLAQAWVFVDFAPRTPGGP